VLPSVAEGSPNVLLESMACGVPVVATDVADNACIVPDGQVGYVVPLGDAAAMADRILRLLENDHLRGSLAKQARRWVVQEFSTARLAARTQAAYLECLASKRIHRAGA
jgi:glycosyltransferase involved in cell wall biosynthesis